MDIGSRIIELRGKILLITGTLLGLVILYWLSGYAFIELSFADTAGQSTVTYNLKGQGSEDSGSTNNPSVRKLVRNGSYEVNAQQNSKNSFAIVNSGRFFQTTKVDLQLRSENKRDFIGDNPQACMSYAGVLVSYPCGGFIESFRLHSEATAQSPSSIKRINTDSVFGHRIMGNITLSNVLYFFAAHELDGGTELRLIPVPVDGSAFSFEQSIKLPDLFQSREVNGFSIVPYGTGFLIYGLSEQQAYYFKSIGDTQPEKISFPAAESNTNLYSVDFIGEKILSVYTSIKITESPNATYRPSVPIGEVSEETDDVFSEGERLTGTSKVVVSTATDQELSLGYIPDQVKFCGNNHICSIYAGNLEIYGFNNNGFNKLLTLSDVTQIESLDNQFVIIKPEGVIRFDAEQLKGYYQYYFNDYLYCGVSLSKGHLLLCVDNQSNTNRSRSVLYINSEADKTDDIDAQILELSKSRSITTIAAYKQFIHIAPRYGEIEFLPDSGEMGYRPETIQTANSLALREVSSLQIDTNRYRIITSIK